MQRGRQAETIIKSCNQLLVLNSEEKTRYVYWDGVKPHVLANMQRGRQAETIIKSFNQLLVLNSEEKTRCIYWSFQLHSLRSVAIRKSGPRKIPTHCKISAHFQLHSLRSVAIIIKRAKEDLNSRP